MSTFRPRSPRAPTPDPDESSETPERVFYDAAARFLDEQFRINEALDSKAATNISVGSTVLPVTFGLLTLGPDRLPDVADWLLGGAVIAYVALLVAVFRANAFRALEYRPRLQTLDDYSGRYPGEVLLQWVAREYVASTELNEPQLEKKAQWTGVANFALYIEGVQLSLAALLTLL